MLLNKIVHILRKEQNPIIALWCKVSAKIWNGLRDFSSTLYKTLWGWLNEQVYIFGDAMYLCAVTWLWKRVGAEATGGLL